MMENLTPEEKKAFKTWMKLPHNVLAKLKVATDRELVLVTADRDMLLNVVEELIKLLKRYKSNE